MIDVGIIPKAAEVRLTAEHRAIHLALRAAMSANRDPAARTQKIHNGRTRTRR